MESVKFCSLCSKCVKIDSSVLLDRERSFECALCFGLCDESFHDNLLAKLAIDFKKSGFDSDSYILALNLPTSIHLREALINTLFGPESLPYSVKDQVSYLLLRKIEKETGLRPTLNSDFTITLNFDSNEFAQKDMDFLLCHFGKQFSGAGKKRKLSESESDTSMYTKLKVEQITPNLSMNIAKQYQMSSPSKPCDFSFLFEREVAFIGGRYCKFSRNLPQSPWAETGFEPQEGNSVSEKICKILEKYFQADGTRFTSSGREDIDVRMLGTGRPFAVQLLNCHILKPLSSFTNYEALKDLQKKINMDIDIQVSDLVRVTAKEASVLNVGQEEKKKHYSAICYTQVPITDDMIKKLNEKKPVEIVQKTVVRVLKRRPLLDRPRTIYSMNALKLDSFHFLLKLETQAGTYVKEFVTGDFGRTTPSVAELMGISLGLLDILQLDVEHVDLEWPPKNE